MKKLITILIILALMPLMNAQEPPIIVTEESGIISQQMTALGGRFETIGALPRGDYSEAVIDLKFNHDCEKYKLEFWYTDAIDPYHPTIISSPTKTVIKDIPHKKGDTVKARISNMPTDILSEKYCGKMISGWVTHYVYVTLPYDIGDNVCHKYEPVTSYDCVSHIKLLTNKAPRWVEEFNLKADIENFFKLTCSSQCDEKWVGNEECLNGDVKKQKQLEDCSTKYITMENCYGNGCANGECLEPCETGNIGSEFCNDNKVYQKVGLGRDGGICKYKNSVVEECLDSQLCDGGQCINTEYCDDGVCNHGETYDTCPADCENPNFCGDGVCNVDEDKNSCALDCGSCSEGDDAKTETCEDETEIITHQCINSEWQPTGDECETTPEIPAWIIPVAIGSVFLIGLVIILMSGKKKKGRKKK